MSLTDQIDVQPTAVQGANNIRHFVRQTVTQMEHALRQIRQAVDDHGRSNIADALGPDAAELTTVYAALKSCLQSISPSHQVPDLPQ